MSENTQDLHDADRRTIRMWALDRALQLSAVNNWNLQAAELTALAAEIETYVEAGK